MVYVLAYRKKALNLKSFQKIMTVCRKCGKEMETEEVSHEYHLDHRRGKVSSDKICSECN